MNKQQIDKKIKEMYTINQSLDESAVMEEEADLFDAVLKAYGSWEKALRSNGIWRKHLKERSRFMLYCRMKFRTETYGEEVLRPKNIDEETKDAILQVYTGLRELTKDTMKNWTESKVMYELRLFLMTGGQMNGLQPNDPELHHHLLAIYGSEEKAAADYLERFGTKLAAGEKKKKAAKPSPVQKESQEEQVDLEELLAMGYLSKQQVQDIRASKEVTEDELYEFLLDEIVEARVENVKLSEGRLKERNAAMYHAVIGRFGTLKKAISQAVYQQVEAK